MTEAERTKEEPKIEAITSILKDELNLTSQQIDREKERKKFVPQKPTEEEMNKIKAADPERFGANLIQIKKGQVNLNPLAPREQEKEGRFRLESGHSGATELNVNCI